MATGNYFLILTRTNIGYGVKKSDRQQKVMMPDGGMNKKKTRIFQTSRMKDRPWLSHDKETGQNELSMV